MVVLSVAVERVIEVLKGIVPWLAKERQGTSESWRQAFLQVLAAVVGAIVVAQAQSQIATILPALSAAQIGWRSDLLFGLLASGGSGLWNHALDIVRALKITQEVTAKKAVAAA
jgi:hypothetical protein